MISKRNIKGSETMSAILLVVNGDVKKEHLVMEMSRAGFVIGVDGGTNIIHALGYTPDLIVGDLDSIREDVLEACRKKGVRILRYPAEKDETDLQLAIEEAMKLNPRMITCVGIFGDRPDHTLANLQLMQVPAKAGIHVRCPFDGGILYVIDSKLDLKGSPGDTVSLLPITEMVSGIALTGFKYSLTDGEMVPGIPLGISNVMESERAHIEINSGILLVFHFQKATSV